MLSMRLTTYDNRMQPITFMSEIEMVKLKEVRKYKDLFLKNYQDIEKPDFIESEVIASWQRSKNYHIDPQMQESHFLLKPQELKALLRDKRTFVELVSFYANALRPLLNIPRMALCIQDQEGTILHSFDHKHLLRLNFTAGTIGKEECIGTTSTSLCVKLGKIVQLAGPLHYCKALENQFATTTPVRDYDGNILGLITTITDVEDVLFNEEIVERVSLWASTLSFTVENQIELSKRTSTSFGETSFTKENSSPFSNILGESPQIQEVIRTAARFAKTKSGVIITGESGTGKEMFAQAIHDASGRRGPLVAINCAALPSNLIASELFGYVGGAFTGAEAKGRTGKIELAKDGTLFLDEIGDMPLEIQPTFLRVLEEKKVIPLGSNKSVPVNFRLIAATNCDLFKLVQEEKFRADLYYRLEVLEVGLPPLREREGDILLLANHFLEQTCRELGRKPLKLSKEVEAFLITYAWPGNIRQLKNVMTYAANICEGRLIKIEDLPKNVHRNVAQNIADQYSKEESGKVPLISSVQETEEEMLRKALSQTGNNVRAASNILGLSKTTIYRKIKKYNIDIKTRM